MRRICGVPEGAEKCLLPPVHLVRVRARVRVRFGVRVRAGLRVGLESG